MIHYMNKCIGTPTGTSFIQLDIHNNMLHPPPQYQFPTIVAYFGGYFCPFIQHLWGQMLDEKAWLSVFISVQPHLFDRVEVRALSWTVKFFHSKLIQPCLYESCHARQASLKVVSVTLSKMSWYAEAVRFSFTGSNRTGFPCSRVQWWCALHHSIRCLAL